MEKLIIEGERQLHGEIEVSGAKNSALPIMAATLLSPGTHTVNNIPHLRDINTMGKLLEHIGANVERQGKSLKITSGRFNAIEAPYDLVKTMRASILVLGPMVGMLRKAKVSLPGGCAIGERPINLHLKALEKMGAKIQLKDGYVEILAKHLHGSEIEFEKVTVTGTENIIMAAVHADGNTLIKNAAQEPEVTDLANFLNSMGAKIQGIGTSTITVEGVDNLLPSKHDVIPDRIEAATLAMAVGICGGRVRFKNFPHQFLETAMNRMREAGIEFTITDDFVEVSRKDEIKSVDITTAPHPGFATDLQAQFMSLMTVANGTSRIDETIFENRFMHVPELRRMGANITVSGSLATVVGQKELIGAPVMATDLRASASLVLAALAAKGKSEIQRIYHLDRGYERIEEKLSMLGAKITRS